MSRQCRRRGPCLCMTPGRTRRLAVNGFGKTPARLARLNGHAPLADWLANRYLLALCDPFPTGPLSPSPTLWPTDPVPRAYRPCGPELAVCMQICMYEDACNGQRPLQASSALRRAIWLWRRHVMASCACKSLAHVMCLQKPSTSPSHTCVCKCHTKLRQWQRPIAFDRAISLPTSTKEAAGETEQQLTASLRALGVRPHESCFPC